MNTTQPTTNETQGAVPIGSGALLGDRIAKTISQTVLCFIIPAIFGIMLAAIGDAFQDTAARLIGMAMSMAGFGGALSANIIGIRLQNAKIIKSPNVES
jgi:hypothetical protein